MELSQSEVAEFFHNRSIFITGATGFLGKVILETLLRKCPLVGKVYILIRPRRKDDISVRMSKLRQDNVFDALRLSKTDVLEKLIAIPGDVNLPKLGISEENWQHLCNEISVVIHAAADVKFNEKLKIAVNTNVKGTQRVVELCRELKNLQVLTFISTAYSNCEKPDIQEIIYPLPNSVRQLLDKIDLLTEEEADEKTNALIQGRPNTYTYTKAMAENILREEAGILPICIVRPSLISGAWKEPTPGWVYGMNGLAGLMAASGTGILRTLYCDKQKVGDFIPVDYCANLILAASFQTAKKRTQGITVYNCCSGTLNPLTYGYVLSDCVPFMVSHPSKRAVRSPQVSFTSNKTKHTIHGFLSESVPAHFAEGINRLRGKKTKMLKYFRIVQTQAKVMSFFSTHEWNFTTENMDKLLMELSDGDKKLFNFDVREINWKTHLEECWLGVKRYLLHETE